MPNWLAWSVFARAQNQIAPCPPLGKQVLKSRKKASRCLWGVRPIGLRTDQRQSPAMPGRMSARGNGVDLVQIRWIIVRNEFPATVGGLRMRLAKLLKHSDARCHL